MRGGTDGRDHSGKIRRQAIHDRVWHESHLTGFAPSSGTRRTPAVVVAAGPLTRPFTFSHESPAVLDAKPHIRPFTFSHESPAVLAAEPHTRRGHYRSSGGWLLAQEGRGDRRGVAWGGGCEPFRPPTAPAAATPSLARALALAPARALALARAPTRTPPIHIFLVTGAHPRHAPVRPQVAHFTHHAHIVPEKGTSGIHFRLVQTHALPPARAHTTGDTAVQTQNMVRLKQGDAK